MSQYKPNIQLAAQIHTAMITTTWEFVGHTIAFVCFYRFTLTRGYDNAMLVGRSVGWACKYDLALHRPRVSSSGRGVTD